MKTKWSSNKLVYTSLYQHLEPDVKFFAKTNTWAASRFWAGIFAEPGENTLYNLAPTHVKEIYDPLL